MIPTVSAVHMEQDRGAFKDNCGAQAAIVSDFRDIANFSPRLTGRRAAISAGKLDIWLILHNNNPLCRESIQFHCSGNGQQVCAAAPKHDEFTKDIIDLPRLRPMAWFLRFP
jgi:hypothetical protein